VRAIYWLYLVTRTYYRKALPGAIFELADDENKEDQSDPDQQESKTLTEDSQDKANLED